MDTSASKQLAYSMLNAAGSMQRLTDELDRLSLHSLEDREPPKQTPSYKDHDPHWLADWPTGLVIEGGQSRGPSNTDSVSSTGSVRHSRRRRVSRSSSKYDSAIGSLPSQTDEETTSLNSQSTPRGEHSTIRHSRKPKRRDLSTYTYSDREWLYHTQQEQKQHRQGKQKSKSFRKHYRQINDSPSSSATTTPTIVRSMSMQSKSYATKTQIHSPVADFLRREGSTRSTGSTGSDSSTSSKRSSRVLSVGLSEDDILELTKLSDKPNSANIPRSASYRSTVIQADFNSSGEKQHAHVVYIPPSTEVDTQDSDSSNTTVVDDDNASTPTEPQQAYFSSTNTAPSMIEGPLTPEIVIIDSENTGRDHQERPSKETISYQDSTSLDPHPNPSLPSENAREIKRYVSHPRVPQRYREAGDHLKPPTELTGHRQKGSSAPKRSASFLQRLRMRRGTSFKSERRPKKRVPVRRSFSDRIMYQIRKGWVDYKEDLNFISNPSQLRPIGRMIDRQAGRFHIVQLHRPPSGRYGIFITETALRRGIFISRFANSNSAKFYSGLIEPGDEIVKVNRKNVRDKSVDYVYDLMAKLDSVVFTIVPVNSRPDW